MSRKKEVDSKKALPPAESSPSANTGVTPVAQVSLEESLKDVVPQPQSGYPGALGYTYFEKEYLEPIDEMPQILIRVIDLEPTGMRGDSSINPDLNYAFGKIVDLWNAAPQHMLDKVLKRDGVRFLPDSFDNANILEWREMLFVAARMQLRVIRSLIDATSWNEGLRFLRPAFARKNRRCMEAENDLSTIEISPLWVSLADSEPVLSPREGGPLLITLPDFSEIVGSLGSVDGTHPAFISKATTANLFTLINTSGAIDNLLCEVENAIKMLRYREDTVAMDGSGAGFTWGAGAGRGVLGDMKYLTILLTELKYPSSGPINGTILVDLGKFNQKLYGEAVYGVDLEDGVPDVRHDVGYPIIGASDQAVLRRGFAPMDTYQEAGMDDLWAVVEDGSHAHEALAWLGMKLQVGVVNSVRRITKFKVDHMDRYGVVTQAAGEYNFDDGTAMRTFFEACPTSDHQWNEGLFVRLDSSEVVKMDQPAAYSFHQSILVPPEGMRAALCTAYNIPYRR